MKSKIYSDIKIRAAKGIATLIALAGFTFSGFSQSEAAAKQRLDVSPTCTLAYEEGSKTLKDVTGFPARCKEIAIVALPPLTQALTEITVEFATTGTYSFIKGANLQVYPDRDVYIEDMLTGKVFDLKNSESYSFNINRRVAHRFYLHIDKELYKYAVSSLAK